MKKSLLSFTTMRGNKKTIPKLVSGFTLIELLVVIAIIGVLSSVVLASLNSARQKGQIAAIKSNLKNMIAQAELSYSDNGSYSGINTSNTDTTCIGDLASMAQSMINQGATVKCLSYNNSSNSDVNLRWGASSLMDIFTPIKAYSVSSTGVTTWDVKGVNSTGAFISGDTYMTWDAANIACSTAGGRLPTLEELKTLSDATWIASTNTTHIPPSFRDVSYWSNTTVPSNQANAYGIYMVNGSFYIYPKASSMGVFTRCVR
jgi:prepilin-type N-terminal cleavage/methylation domain-containing protein